MDATAGEWLVLVTSGSALSMLLLAIAMLGYGDQVVSLDLIEQTMIYWCCACLLSVGYVAIQRRKQKTGVA